MKKIISLVVMATMLCTLFAVNVSAAVFTGEATTELVPTYTFDTVPDGWTALSAHHGNDYTGASAVKEDAAQGNVLSITPQGAGESFGSVMGHKDNGALTMPSKYEISFKVKLTAATGGFMVWIRDIGAHYGIGAGCFETNDWYEMKITVDKATSTYTRMMRNITDNGAWTDCPSTSDFNTGRWITAWQTSSSGRPNYAAGIVFISNFGTNQNNEYLFDDFAIKGISTIPSVGVTLTQDYEGNSTAFTKTQNNEGTVAIETANGNSYAVVTPKADGNLRVTATGVTSATGWVGGLPNTTGGNSVLQFDIYATADTKAPVVVEFCSATGSYSIFSLPALPKKETWYTYKVTQGSPKDVNSSAAVVRSERGTGVWTQLVNGTDFAWKGNANSGVKAEVVIGSSNNTYGMPTDAFYLDNITLSTMESYSYVAAREGNNLTVDFAHDKVKELIQTTQRAVMLATFADGVLVDVDYQAVANDGGTVAAELEASALGANKAELYVWEVGTGRPVMTNALNLTSYIQ